jgi:hypothetical protein
MRRAFAVIFSALVISCGSPPSAGVACEDPTNDGLLCRIGVNTEGYCEGGACVSLPCAGDEECPVDPNQSCMVPHCEAGACGLVNTKDGRPCQSAEHTWSCLAGTCVPPAP